MDKLVTLDDLKEVTGYSRVGNIEAWLQRNDIPYLESKKGKIFTTLGKLNEALSNSKMDSKITGSNMGKPRKTKNLKYPKYVYNNNGTIVYRPRIDGKLAKPIRLGNTKSPMSEIFSAYESATGLANDTLFYLVSEYKKSDAFNNLKSKRAVAQAFDRLLNIKTTGQNGEILFGLSKLDNITPGTIHLYLDCQNNTSVNREISFLSAA